MPGEGAAKVCGFGEADFISDFCDTVFAGAQQLSCFFQADGHYEVMGGLIGKRR